MIIECTCIHEYQDATYGNKMRVHNKTAKENEWRCSICGSNKTKGSATTEKKGKKK